MQQAFQVGSRVKTPVYHPSTGRRFLHGTVVKLIHLRGRNLFGIDTGTTVCWYPLEELLAD